MAPSAHLDFHRTTFLSYLITILYLCITDLPAAQVQSMAVFEVPGQAARAVNLHTNNFVLNTQLYMRIHDLFPPSKGGLFESTTNGYRRLPPWPSLESNVCKCIAHHMGASNSLQQIVVNLKQSQVFLKGNRKALESAVAFLEELNRPTPEVIVSISFAEITREQFTRITSTVVQEARDPSWAHEGDAPNIGLLTSGDAKQIRQGIVAAGHQIVDLPSRQAKCGTRVAATKKGIEDYPLVEAGIGQGSNVSLYGLALYVWLYALPEAGRGGFRVELSAVGTTNDVRMQRGAAANTVEGFLPMWARLFAFRPEREVMFVARGLGDGGEKRETDMIEVAFISIRAKDQ